MRVSVDSSGDEGNNDSRDSSLSGDGQFVTFYSIADDLVPGDTNGHYDALVRDRSTGETTRVSVSSSGVEGDDWSSSYWTYTPDPPVLSEGGRLVAFSSFATNLVSGDTNGAADVFVHDRVTGETSRVSRDSSGDEGNLPSTSPSISADGRYVAFSSQASNLVGGDTNGAWDIFVHDRVTGQTQRASVDSESNQALPVYWGASYKPSLSADGRYLAFESASSTLVAGDTNDSRDVFVRDLVAGTTRRVSVDTGGAQGNDWSYLPTIAPGGRFVAFGSDATNLSEGDSGSWSDAFVHDLVTGETTKISVAASGGEANGRTYQGFSLSAGGRYVTFESGASNLVAGDTNGYYDVFVYDRLKGATTLVSVTTSGGPANSYSFAPWVSADGRFVSYRSQADNLVPSDTNGCLDVFVFGIDNSFLDRPVAELFGRRKSAGYAGDPVNTALGNFTDTSVDVDFPGAVFGLDWSRTYNSLDTTAGPLGVGWSSGLGARLVPNPGGPVVFHDGDGRRVTFAPDGGGGYLRPEEMPADLVARPGAAWSLVYDDGHTDDFDSDGRLVARDDDAGQAVDLAYDGQDRLSAVDSTTGYGLSFSYDNANRIVAVTAQDGRSVTYTYDPLSGGLATATAADGGLTSYDTDGSGRINRVTDADGVEVIANVYDDVGRVIHQDTPSGGGVDFAYDDEAGVTTLTNTPSGAVTAYAHDDQGRLTSVTDPFGRVLTKAYDAAGNLVTVTDRRGGGITQSFDGRGNMLARSGPEGVEETFSFDSSNRRVTMTDGSGAVTAFTYEGDERLPSTMSDGNGKVTSFDVVGGLVTATTDPDGVTLSMGYDTRRNLTSITDENAETVTFAYDAAGNLIGETTPLGRTTSYGRDALGRTLSVTDPTTATGTATYTPAGRLTTRTDELDQTTSFAYDQAGRLSSVTDAMGKVTTKGYDVDGNLTSLTRPGNSVWTATYDKLGRRTSETDPTGVTMTYGFDEDGNMTTATDENGAVVTRTYDLRGRLTKVRDQLNRETVRAYDDADRLIRVTDPLSNQTRFTYDGVGRRLTTTEPGGRIWRAAYTDAGRLSAETDPASATTTYTYSPAGQRVTATRPEGGTTTSAFDDDDRLASVRSPAGLVTAYGYDDLTRQTTMTSPAGGVTTRTFTATGLLASLTEPATGPQSFLYDAMGRMTKATDALGRHTTFAYDDRGNMVTRTDARGKTEQWTYDLSDRPSSHSDALGRSTTQAYDVLGRLATVADPSGRSVNITYDAASQITGQSYTMAGGPAVAVTYAHDAVGRRTALTDPSGTTSYTYDGVGQMTSTTAGGKTLGFGYDLAGNRTSLTYPDATVAAFSFDGDGRLTTLAHPQAGSVDYTYDVDGRLLGEDLPGSDARSYGYDAVGRLATYVETLAGKTATTTLGHDLAGRVTSESRTVPAAAALLASYGYDPAGQLTGVTRGSGLAAQTTSYTYDPVGNRTTKAVGATSTTYAYDAANQLTSAARRLNGLTFDTVALRHDGAGRLTAVTAAAGSRGLAYDAKGALATVSASTGLLSTTTQRTSDGDGRMVAISATTPLATTATTLTWDSAASVPQVAVSSTDGVETDYLWGIGRELAVRAGQGDAFATDVYGSAEKRGEAADLARASRYDEFGKPLLGGAVDLIDEVVDHPDQNLRFGYRGEATVDGLVHLRARDYAPGLGRFTTVDPLDGVAGEVTVANPYPYAANDPLNKIDPLGLSWRQPCIGSACLLDTPGALVDTLSNVPTPRQAYRHLRDEGGASVDRYIAQFGEVPTGLDLVNVAINPGYKTIDRCSAYACGSGAALDCALATADLVGTALALEQVGVGVTRAVVSRTIVSDAGSIGGSAESAASRGAARLSPNQMNQAIARGQSPRGIVRIDTPKVPQEQLHATFENGAALNVDGTWKHGATAISRAQRAWLESNGWVVP